jgi:hypothetical protein
VEERADRAVALRATVNQQLGVMGNPHNVKVTVHPSSFDVAYSKIKSLFRNGKLPPTFAFIDPFGWTGLPFGIVRDILSYRSCEVLVNFMYEEINRFIAHPDQGGNFDQLFGSIKWRQCSILDDARERNSCLHDAYGEQLSTAAPFVRSFEMRNARDATDYYLFFATSSIDGLKKMKESMWKVDRAGVYTFSDATDPNQTVLFDDEPRFDVLRRQILERFSGSQVVVDDVERFVVTETAFRETHYKVQILKVLEYSNPPALEVVQAKVGRKRGQFPAGTVVRFP